jgi:hypothetical protein
MMRVPIEGQCPECGHEVDDATGVGETERTASPQPGDLAICIRCGEPAAYRLNPDGLTLGLRALTEPEKVELSDREDIAGIQKLIRDNAGKWLS